MRKQFFLHVPNEDSNQPTCLHSLIRVFIFSMKKLCICGYPNASGEDSDQKCLNRQADLNLCWVHMSEGIFSDIDLY